MWEAKVESEDLFKDKVMKIGKNLEQNEMNVHLNNKRMDEVDTYRYLGVDISNDGGMSE